MHSLRWRIAFLCAIISLLPIAASAASTPLTPSRCPDPIATDPSGPMTKELTSKTTPEEGERFLKTATYCPSACYDIVATARLTWSSLELTYVPQNKCTSPNIKRGCGGGLQEPQLTVITKDVYSATYGFKVPDTTVVKSRCDDTVISNAFQKFLEGLEAATTKDPKAAEAQMLSALNDMRTQTDPRPAAEPAPGASVAVAPASTAGFGSSAPPAFGVPGASPFPEILQTSSAGAEGGTSPGAPAAQNPILETVKPDLTKPQGAPAGSGQAAASDPSAGDFQKIYDVQSKPQSGAPIEKANSAGKPEPPTAGAQNPSTPAPGTEASNGEGPSSKLETKPSNQYQPLSGPSAVNNSDSKSGGSSWLSMLGSLLGPLMSIFTGSSSNPPLPPAPTLAMPSATLSTASSSVARGESISVTWSSNHVSTLVPCTLSQDGTQIGQGYTGTMNVPTSTSTPDIVVFALQCRGQSGGQIQQSASVTVQ